MPAWLSALLGAVANAVLPIVVGWIQKLIPSSSAHFQAQHPCPAGVDPKAHYRATVRQWVTDGLQEVTTKLVGLIPTSLSWLSALVNAELPTVNSLLATAVDNALDSAGL